MKGSLKNRKNNNAVVNLHKCNYFISFFYNLDKFSELNFKQKKTARKTINSLYRFIFLIPKKVRLYTKPPPKLD